MMSALGMSYSRQTATAERRIARHGWRWMVWGMLGLGFIGLWNGAPLIGVAQASDGPQELAKPTIRQTPALFREWNFDRDPVDAAPPGFASGGTTSGQDGAWLVKKESTARSGTQVTVQNSTCQDASCYQVLLGDETEVAYVDVSVQMKLLRGMPSGKGGVVLGAKDSQNFYAIVVTPETNMVEAFVVRNGQMTSFGEAELKPDVGDWHVLRVQRNPMISHDLMNVFFDKHMLLSLSDSTFKKGKVGLVTSGDGAFAFDNFRAVEYLTNLPLSRPPAY